MEKIFKNQTNLTIRLLTGQNIEGASLRRIKYKKPDGTEGYFSAVAYNENNGTISYTIANNTDLDQSGVWTFWAYITFSNGLSAPGEAVKININNEGE